MFRACTVALLMGVSLLPLSLAQQLPKVGERARNPNAQAILQHTCRPQSSQDQQPRRKGQAWQREYALRRAYARVMPAYMAAVPAARDPLLLPVEGVSVAHVADTWGAARSEGRVHEGVDIFAPAGTRIYSATPGYIYRIGTNPYGGKVMTIVGGGGVRYYYAHLSAYAQDLAEGQHVTPKTLLGYVGNSGNAAGTPPHLHLGVYGGGLCNWDAENPYGRLQDRDWSTY